MLYENISNDNELWYKDGIIYQVHIKAYRDNNNDGIGDIKGLIEKLDYIKSLGINILWLLPFYPSPMKDDGYDIADYFNINPDYGNIDDFKKFLKEAHKRGLKVITELVMNHTSDQHQWFQTARKSEAGSPQRDYYVWSETPDKYKDARIIFSDFETSNWAWDPIAKAYYWHRFYSHQPDLNFENPEIHKLMFRAVDYWFEMGVDGLRLDAVPYLYEREGTNCENLSETHQFLKNLNDHIKNKFKNKMLLAEANQWPEDAVAYFGDGDECHMAFHFPLMPRMYMAIQMETRFPIIDILEQTPPIPENCQWAMFLRNHDELTLEMVTDEERDYMYRFYAQDSRARLNLGIRRRLAPLVENNRRKIELLNILLFSFPGTPIIYYGDEIGMGDNYYLGDRNGVRTPMQWSPDRNAGFSYANPQRLYLPVIIDPEYNYEAVNVEVQQRNSSSLLWWMKRTISVRKNYKAFGRGSIEFLKPNNPKVLAFFRRYKDETILVVTNLSRFSQVVELDLSEFAGYTPIEIFSRNKFPAIRDNYYMLTLNAYDYYWFLFNKKEDDQLSGREIEIPEAQISSNINVFLEGDERKTFEDKILLNYLNHSGWFEPGEQKIESVEIIDDIKISSSSNSCFLLLKIFYIDKPAELFMLLLIAASGEKANRILIERNNSVLALINNVGEKTIFYDGVYDEHFQKVLLLALLKKKNIKGKKGELFFSKFISLQAGKHSNLQKVFNHSSFIQDENKSINILFDELLLLRLYRKLDVGINPAEEILKFLSEKTSFKNFPPYIGSVRYSLSDSESITIGLLKENVLNQGTAWNYFADASDHYYELILERDKEEVKKFQFLSSLFIDLKDLRNSPNVSDAVETMYTENVSLLGKRTGEMHSALGSSETDPVFKPEIFNAFYNRSVYQTVRSNTKTILRFLEKNYHDFDEELKKDADKLLSLEKQFLIHIEKILKRKISAKKIRIHGDYHLGQVWFTGKDFIITNFEGPAYASLSERKLKRSCLRDAASMIYSLRYAAFSSLYKFKAARSEDYRLLEPYAEQWWLCLSNIFMTSYYENIKESNILPDDKEELKYLMQIYLIDKMITELSNCLKINPEKIFIPLKGLLHISNYFEVEL